MSILSICLLTGILHYKYFEFPIKIFFYCILFAFIVEWFGFYSLYLSSDKRINSLIYAIYNPLEFTIIGLYFYYIVNAKKTKKLFILLIILVVLIEVTSTILKFSMFKTLMIAFFFSSILSLVYFKQLLDSDVNVVKNPNFWIVTGILFFNAGFFFLSGFVSYLSQKDLELARKLFSINHLLNIIYYSLVAYGFICQRRLAKSSS